MDEEQEKEPTLPDIFGGTLNILGLKIDLGKLLESPEELRERLTELREKLKAAGGKEILSDEDWRQGHASISGHIRTRGVLGDQEYHIGTMGQPVARERDPAAPRPPEVLEPPIDVFDEEQQVTIVADVPGVTLEDLELQVQGRNFSLSTKPTARRRYHKELRLDAEPVPASLEATCRNGVLEVRLRKRPEGDASS